MYVTVVLGYVKYLLIQGVIRGMSSWGIGRKSTTNEVVTNG